MDWDTIFGLSQPIAETVLRGSVVYWFLYLLFRFILHRDVGAVGIADVLFLVLIADAAQNAMAGSYQTITDGVILMATIAFWNWLLDHLSFRYPSIRWLLRPRPLPLIRDGRVIYRNLRRELISLDELAARVREKGIRDLSQVRNAYMEDDGAISVIEWERGKRQQAPDDSTHL